jgi:hypothetical protein
MSTDLIKVKRHFIAGDIAALSRELKVTQSYIHRVISGKAQNREITLAILRKAEERKQEAEEIERLQQSL